jgi:hypothetical protein
MRTRRLLFWTLMAVLAALQLAHRRASFHVIRLGYDFDKPT